MSIVVRLFGDPAVSEGSERHAFGTTIDDAVLCYLALQGDWIPRGVMAGRFWPDSNETSARANLRWRLHRVRARSYARGLEATRDHVRWPVATDLAEFWQAHGERAYERAVDLVRAPLLGDTRFECSPLVEAVFQREREQVHRAWREAALVVAAEAVVADRHAHAASVLQRVLDHEMLDEEVLQAYLRAAYLDGQREAALRTFADFERHLRDEFGIAPLADTRSIVATIKGVDDLVGSVRSSDGASHADAAALPAPAAAAARTPAAAASDEASRAGRDALPRFLTSFVGRVDEREQLAHLLDAEGERLVTVLGLGGVGKTRLAVEVARDLAPRFSDGVAFADVAELDDPARLSVALLEALVPNEHVANDPDTHLVDLVNERELLLVIDTFEHVLAAAPLLSRLTAEAPRVSLLVTSRVRLGVPGERAFEVGGLRCPDVDASPEAIAAHPAVALFESVAARSLGGFRATERDLEAIARVCRLVGGLPLAIELAATWVRVLSSDEIASELSVDAELLTAAAEGLHEHRHARFEQVFATSWSLLRPEDRDVFAALSVFRGGFTRESAVAVAGAELRHLRALIDASLVRRVEDRYVLLDVMRRLAEQRLEASGQARAVRKRYAEHFARWLHALESDVGGPDGTALSDRLGPESDNLRAAWAFAVETRNVSVLTRMSRGVSSLWDLRGRFAEAARLFANAASALEQAEQDDDAQLGWAWMRLREGWFRCYLGEYDALRPMLCQAFERFERYGETAAAGSAVYVLANAANARGDLGAGREYLAVAIDAYRRAGDGLGLAKCESALGVAEEALGNYHEAHVHHRRSLRERERSGDPRGVIVVRNDLAAVAVELGALDEAEEHLRHALALSAASSDAWGAAWTDHNRGDVALARGRHDVARACYERALAGLVRLGHHYAATLPRERLGELLLETAPDEAVEHLRAGLRTALAIDAVPRVVQLVARLARLRAQDDPEAAVAALACARAAAGPLHRSRVLTERLLEALGERLGEDAFRRAERSGVERDLRQEAEALLRWSEVVHWPTGSTAAPGVGSA